MEIREKIIEEALSQFLTYGIRNVTMDRIAANIGISKRTVYEIFKDKTELIHTCIKELRQKHEERNHEIISSSRNVIDTIFTFMREGIKNMSSINPVFFMDMKKFWLHSIATGIIASLIAIELGYKKHDRFFLGGLLHDIGFLLFLKNFL